MAFFNRVKSIISTFNYESMIAYLLIVNKKIQLPFKSVQMKKSYLVAKDMLGLIIWIPVTSCISGSDSPILIEQLEKSVVISEENSGKENLRKGIEIDFKETFTNPIGFVQVKGCCRGPSSAFLSR